MAIDLAKIAKENGIRYFLVSFVDLFGVLRAKLVPAHAIGTMQVDGAGFAGFAAWVRHDARRSGHVRHSGSGEPHPTALEPRGRLAGGRLVDGR